MELSIKDASCGYGNNVILKDISFSVKQGEIVVFSVRTVSEKPHSFAQYLAF